MPTDLTAVHDHPAAVLRNLLNVTKMVADTAAGALEAYEREHNVTFAALDNEALAEVREAYDGLYPQIEPRDAQAAVERLAAAVNALLGMDD